MQADFFQADSHNNILVVWSTFVLTTRVFEISLALIYQSESFLAQEEWHLSLQNMCSGVEAKDGYPNESCFDLMIVYSILSI